MFFVNTAGCSVKINVKVKIPVEQVLKAKRRTKSIAVLFL